MTPHTTYVPVSSFTCPGCDCRMCSSDAVRAIESLEGVLHVRLDRRRGAFVVRHDPGLADTAAIASCLSEAGLEPT